MEAASVLSGMFTENSSRRKFDVFVDEICGRWPELSGFFEKGVDVPCGEGEVFGCGWDTGRRKLVVGKGIPPRSQKTAFELCKGLQYAAIARDDVRGGEGEALVNEKKVISTYVSWGFAHACLKLPPEELLTHQGDHKLFSEWCGLTPAVRLEKIAETHVRWTDPKEVSSRITPILPLLAPATTLLPGHEASPLTPAAYHTLELSRQRLIRASLDDRLPATTASVVKSILKRAARHNPDTIQPYLQLPYEEVQAVLERGVTRGEDLVLVVQMEIILQEVERAIGGRLAV